MEAERCWAFAMELKEAMVQEGNGKGRRSQFISRLRKATKYTERLDKLCDFAADEKTSVEATAYSNWMQGCLCLELESWESAHKHFTLASSLLDKLAQHANPDEKFFFSSRVEEMVPSIRYCKYNMGGGESGGER